MAARPLLMAAVVSLALVGCSGPPVLPAPPSVPKVEVRAEAAPSATHDATTLRADQVTRRGGTVAVALTVGQARSDVTVTQSRLRVTTSSGARLNSAFENVTVGSNEVATMTVVVPLPTPDVRELGVQLEDGLQVRVPVPEADATWAWLPAPTRQGAIQPKPSRSETEEYVLESVRTEGLVTEVAVRGSGFGRALGLCTTPWDSRCSLLEPDGTEHPLLPGTTKAGDGSRLRAVLRFLGEIRPDSRELTLRIPRYWSDTPDPVTVPLPSHADSPVRVAAGGLARPDTALSPVELTQAETGAKVKVDALQVLDDRVQLHVTATGGTKDFDLAQAMSGASFVQEPNGFKHPLQAPADAKLVVAPGATLDATLVFAGSVPADVTSLTLNLGGWYRLTPVTTTLTIAPTPTSTPETTTFGQVDQPAAPAPEVRAVVPPAPSPTSSAEQVKPTVHLTDVDVRQLPASSSAVLGPVRTAITGVGTTQQVASGTSVDPKADAGAQRTLQDLGAQRTPDGWVLTLPETVLFGYNKADVLPNADAKLAEVAKLLAYFDKAKIAVQGHTDSTGEAAYNLDLSKRRAQAVADALAGKGVQSSRMTVEGFGLTRPIAPNTTDAGKAKNRRVEIVLRDNA